MNTGNTQVSVEFLDRIQERFVVVWEQDMRSVFSVKSEAFRDSDLRYGHGVSSKAKSARKSYSTS